MTAHWTEEIDWQLFGELVAQRMQEAELEDE